jgi:hypothetical protein
MPNIDLSILNQRQTPAFFADTLANRPAAGFLGRIFVSTDTFAFYRDNGTGWDLIGGPGTGTITGTGTNGQIALWTGASTINGDSGLLYNSTVKSLTASKYIVTGGTSTQFLKGDGTLDSNTYNTGSGAASQVAFFSGTNAITGENNLWWDSVNGHLGIGTNVPTTALTIFHDQNQIIQLNQTTATNDTKIAFQNSGTPLWRIGNSYNSGANDWGIFDVVGSSQPFTIKKTTGQTFIGTETTSSGRLVVNNATGDNHIVVIGATAPSLRINNSGSGATKQIGIGLATATNNFIQGSADRDMCIFNGSTTISPILFGIYQTTNVQEVARFSVAGNLLVGKTTDAGYKLDVSGSSRISGNLLVEAPSQDNILSVIGQSGFEGALFISSAGSGKDANIVFGNGRNLEFHTSSSTTPVVSGTQLMTLTASGNLGIGTGSPTEKLVVTGNIYTNGTNSNIYIDNGGVGGASLKIGVTGTTETYIYSLEANDPLLFGTNNTERLRISSTGNLLIGTTTDNGQKLQVNGTALATKFQGAVNTISNATTPFGSEVSGANLYFQGSLSNGQQFGSIGGTYIFGLYFIFYIDNTTGLRGSAIYMAGDPVANGGFNLVTQSGALTFSNVYNLAASISLANNASNRGPILTNNTTNTLTFYSYVFGGV